LGRRETALRRNKLILLLVHQDSGVIATTRAV
jgi:hypothetical protein